MQEKNRKIIYNIVMRGEFIVSQLVSYFLPYLVHFMTFFARRPHFCFMQNLTISFVMDGEKSKGTNIAIASPDSLCKRY